ncbi:hypothetical protein PR202_ga14794 [Eleusine coracana subsp. coracana]|uniref:Transmembrane protein n=1 Tax=Eleusine coracana subsp. coracana TaxID=191504 RepID=A0AAV5CHG5_ELECO|nr:hypothetical protein PR202_ga14794 [Eleusine coracana subsp. coracana]
MRSHSNDSCLASAEVEVDIHQIRATSLILLENMKAWASIVDDPLKSASSASSHPSNPLRRYSPTTLAVGGLVVVGALSYFMFGSNPKNRDDKQARRA